MKLPLLPILGVLTIVGGGAGCDDPNAPYKGNFRFERDSGIVIVRCEKDLIVIDESIGKQIYKAMLEQGSKTTVHVLT